MKIPPTVWECKTCGWVGLMDDYWNGGMHSNECKGYTTFIGWLTKTNPAPASLMPRFNAELESGGGLRGKIMIDFSTYCKVSYTSVDGGAGEILTICPPEGIKSLQSVLDLAEEWIKKEMSIKGLIITGINEIDAIGFVISTALPKG